jgi:hypothetical protein
MAWRQLHNNIPYGFTGSMKSGYYTIEDIQILKLDVELPDGIWENIETGHCIAILTTGLGYYKVYTDSSIQQHGVERKIAIMDSNMVLSILDSHTFFSRTPINIVANEIYGTYQIKGDEHIIVEFQDPSDDEDSL